MWLGSGACQGAKGSAVTFFMVHYLGTILNSPKAGAVSPVCQEPWPAVQRRGRSAEAISEPGF